MGEPAYRANQLYDWMHKKAARGYDEMTNLPKTFTQKCRENFSYTSLALADMQTSAIDGTRKFLFSLGDGNLVESVLMEYHHGASLCISSQAGCRMGCAFCASGIGGLVRNLLPSEMADQVYAAMRITGEKISHVVVMGTGEPLDNYDALLRFLTLLTDENGLNISGRSVTVSTCGLCPQIKKLAEEKLSLTLAISLHAAIEEKRKNLMPVAKSYSLAELTEACRYYFSRTGRRITLEYSLISGYNDSPRDAEALISFARTLHAHVNLIAVNPVSETPYRAPAPAQIEAFKNSLATGGINVTIRREMGQDIDGACGQLRRRHQGQS